MANQRTINHPLTNAEATILGYPVSGVDETLSLEWMEEMTDTDLTALNWSGATWFLGLHHLRVQQLLRGVGVAQLELDGQTMKTICVTPGGVYQHELFRDSLGRRGGSPAPYKHLRSYSYVARLTVNSTAWWHASVSSNNLYRSRHFDEAPPLDRSGGMPTLTDLIMELCLTHQSNNPQAIVFRNRIRYYGEQWLHLHTCD